MASKNFKTVQWIKVYNTLCYVTPVVNNIKSPKILIHRAKLAGDYLDVHSVKERYTRKWKRKCQAHNTQLPSDYRHNFRMVQICSVCECIRAKEILSYYKIMLKMASRNCSECSCSLLLRLSNQPNLCLYASLCDLIHSDQLVPECFAAWLNPLT